MARGGREGHGPGREKAASTFLGCCIWKGSRQLTTPQVFAGRREKICRQVGRESKSMVVSVGRVKSVLPYGSRLASFHFSAPECRTSCGNTPPQ